MSWIDDVAGLDADLLERARAEEAAGRDAADFLLAQKVSGVLEALSAGYDRPALLLDTYEPQEEALAKVPEETARRFQCLPLFMLRGRLFVATPDPTNLAMEDYLAQLSGLEVHPMATTTRSVLDAITRCYLGPGREPRGRAAEPTVRAPEKAADIHLEPGDSPSVRYVQQMLAAAVRLRASDIHLEPFEDSVMLRYRLDGLLREYPPPPLDLVKAVTSRIKIISNLDVSERRLPQDGRASVQVDDRDFDLRVSIIPNLYGESVVIRILDIGSAQVGLGDLGLSEGMLERYLRLARRPYGIVLVTGPTGSGKSTTLYATLRRLLTPEKKIVTLEDPIESQIHGITQFQMNAAIGFTFARTLRSVLRHDPEIILVGEIRDLETAEIAIRSSLTGHMLFSTLHTNDAPSAATRLIDMGVPPYMVMTTLHGVLAQRLLRRLCLQCKIPLQPSAGLLEALDIPALPADATPFQAVGCAHCAHLGYRGRIGIYELLEITGEMRRLPAEQMTGEHLTRMAAGNGFVSLRESALEKWYQGVTGSDEVLNVTMEA